MDTTAALSGNLSGMTRREMLEISANIPQAEIRDIRIFTEENQNIIFLRITKR